jgi:nicotinate-nucleotide--dimethylbenzimidazole phosphoribosyltransferase
VTAEMVKNFSNGGAAISVLAKQHDIELEIINLGLVGSLPQLDKVFDCHISCGTGNFLTEQAMTIEQMEQVFDCVQLKINALKEKQCQLFLGGEMGIANTTSATALVCALENIEPELLSGAGTGLDDEGIQHKADIIRLSIKQHKSQLRSPIDILCCLGGYEIVALCASYICCAQQGIVSLVDGFICSVAALFAIRINPQCKDWLIFSHQSAEQGHKKVMQLIGLSPLLHFNLRLGEGSGAAVSYPLLRSACLLHSHMASFAQAGVSEASVLQE